ncbi:hypothetical protein EUV02_12955 [Polymorphobacter arshaanensis]|uniref:Protein SirB1 N-terminal domain-containing protein n=1 Tax=Glacieibacterium arshaanense TaxID=2511025 RepID=A0A4Y9EKI3_9SPHN|nr:transglutaminase-like domain-containing protein [Polymorphobacter arshaanensis]TFU01208.1 hypothetical protein EUV02_12955 [Polymorphobacter arshaanensis]
MMIDDIEADIAELGLLEDDEILLDEAALLLGLADHPDADIDDARAEIDAMTARIEALGGLGGSSRLQAERLAHTIAYRCGLRGDREDYDNPANADFLAMFERRRGLPVTLSILYVALARRLGGAADIVGLPGHVVVRIGDGGDTVVIDPFSDGGIINRPASELRDPVREGVQLSNRAALVRLLTNQAARAHNAGDLDRALVLARRMTMIAPDFSSVWWERAQLEQRLGDHAAARESLVAMRETTRDANLQTRIDATLAGLAR